MAGLFRRLLGRGADASERAGSRPDDPVTTKDYGLPEGAELVEGPPVFVGPLNAQPADLALPDALGIAPESERWLRDVVWSQVVLGHTDPDDVLDLWQDELEEHGISDAQADEAVRHVVRARREQQASWGQNLARTPLQEAFTELEEIGVLARADFSCCGTCAASEIGDERDDSRQWRGYLWFHQQDTESLLEDRSTYLGYGVFLDAYLSEEEWLALDDDGKDATYTRHVRELMQGEVEPVLRRHGLGWEWDGDLGTRILVTGVDHYVPV